MTEADRVAFGAAVRAERERRGWTQDELAAAAGLSKRTIIRIEAGGAVRMPLVYDALESALGWRWTTRETRLRAALAAAGKALRTIEETALGAGTRRGARDARLAIERTLRES